MEWKVVVGRTRAGKNESRRETRGWGWAGGGGGGNTRSSGSSHLLRHHGSRTRCERLVESGAEAVALVYGAVQLPERYLRGGQRKGRGDGKGGTLAGRRG
jgi:hypothetical protein